MHETKLVSSELWEIEVQTGYASGTYFQSRWRGHLSWSSSWSSLCTSPCQPSSRRPGKGLRQVSSCSKLCAFSCRHSIGHTSYVDLFINSGPLHMFKNKVSPIQEVMSVISGIDAVDIGVWSKLCHNGFSHRIWNAQVVHFKCARKTQTKKNNNSDKFRRQGTIVPSPPSCAPDGETTHQVLEAGIPWRDAWTWVFQEPFAPQTRHQHRQKNAARK